VGSCDFFSNENATSVASASYDARADVVKGGAKRLDDIDNCLLELAASLPAKKNTKVNIQQQRLLTMSEFNS
jgi:hypothetical protein